MTSSTSQHIPGYELSKTLRFSLIPQFETEKYIKEGELIKEDKERDEAYSKAKEILDKYHKNYIEKSLKDFRLPQDSLEKAAKYKEESDKEQLKKEYESLRMGIVKKFTEGDACKEKKRGKIEFESVADTLNKLLPKNNDQQKNHPPIDLNDQEKELLRQFKGLTTPYFSQYATARNNVYTAEDQATAFAYRTINDNLDKFLLNRQNWGKVQEKLSDQQLQYIKEQLSNELNRLCDECSDQNDKLNNVFKLQTFNKCILQEGIELYKNILCGKNLENGENIKGINQLINEYNQTVEKKDRLPRLIPLYKQIMGNAVSLSFVKPCFDTNEELWDAVNDYYLKELLGDADEKESYLSQIAQLIEDLDYESAQGVFINSRKISSVSQQIFGDYRCIESLFEAEWKEKNGSKKKQEEFKMPDECELSELLRIIGEEKHQDVMKSLKSVKIATNEDKDCSLEKAVEEIKKRFDKIRGLCNNTNNARADIDLRNYSSQKEDLKHFLDALLEFCHVVFTFCAKKTKKETEKKCSEDFYKIYDDLANKLNLLPSLYDKVRNFATRKPYSTKKYRVFFGANDRCKGWAYSRESANKSFILRKLNKSGNNFYYYLGIYTDQCKKKDYLNDDNGNLRCSAPLSDVTCYEKMMMAFIPQPLKMLPKIFFSKDWKKKHDIPKCISIIKNGETYKTDLASCHQLIDYYKQGISSYDKWKNYRFNFKKTTDYESLKEFCQDIEKSAYNVSFESVPEEEVHKMVKEGKLLLFQIYNKDFSEHSTGRKNLHTTYWDALFSPENLENPLYKLNGEAELFFREASIEETNTTTHKKGDKKESKNPDSPKKGEIQYFPHNIIKDKRFTRDSYQFHVPITMNYRFGKAKTGDFNESCVNYLKQLHEEDVHFIGIDRGERHLIYLSLIDRHGHIVKQKTYNFIESETTYADGTSHSSKYDYHFALGNKEKERKNARVNWDAITAIKDLKSGFLSQVISDIARMMVDYHAVVALEDLNFGFKRGRFKIEKQVYQKFEKALIDKLNYLVFKENAPDEQGGIRKPLQLTAHFESFQKLGKQTGMLFYVPAAYTSKIDPTTGFVDQLKPCYINEHQAQEYFQKFESIKYDPANDYFVFTADYEKFGKCEQKQIWEICTHGDACRSIFRPKEKKPVSVDVTKDLKAILEEKGIEYEQGQDLRPALENGDKKLLKAFIDGLKVVLRLRYEDAKGNDVLISPVKNQQGFFFNSSGKNDKLPEDPDANGAYHIALKMLMLYEKRIKNHNSGEKLELFIKNKDWFDYACQRFKKP